jgi:DNA-binding GntR family transcriptional regulator
MMFFVDRIRVSISVDPVCILCTSPSYDSGCDVSVSELGLPRVTPRVLRHDVYHALRTAILTGRIPPGKRLRESEVTESMGVSRAPVREAVRQLEQEGLVETVPHRGVVVVGLAEEEVETVYELRALIEERAFARAAGRLTDDDEARLAEMLDEMAQAAAQHDVEAVAELDLRFHELIVQTSGFSLLARVWSTLDGRVRMRTYQAFSQAGDASDYFFENNVAAHRELLEALRGGDAEVAARAAREHVLGVSVILDKYSKRNDEDDSRVSN